MEEKVKRLFYTAPEVDVVEVKIELGFANSSDPYNSGEDGFWEDDC